MARLIAPNRGYYPRQYAGNPLAGRRVVLAGVNGMGFMGRLGDGAPDFAAAADAASNVLPNLATPAADPTASLNWAPGTGPNADQSDQFAQLTLQQDAAYLPATTAAASPSAQPSTPTPPSNSSVDWTKLITTASAGLLTAGGTVAADAIKAKSANQQAQAARQAQLSAAAKAAALAKAGLKTATSSTGLIVIGGVAVVGLIIFLASRK